MGSLATIELTIEIKGKNFCRPYFNGFGSISSFSDDSSDVLSVFEINFNCLKKASFSASLTFFSMTSLTSSKASANRVLDLVRRFKIFDFFRRLTIFRPELTSGMLVKVFETLMVDFVTFLTTLLHGSLTTLIKIHEKILAVTNRAISSEK